MQSEKTEEGEGQMFIRSETLHCEPMEVCMAIEADRRLLQQIPDHAAEEITERETVMCFVNRSEPTYVFMASETHKRPVTDLK